MKLTFVPIDGVTGLESSCTIMDASRATDEKKLAMLEALVLQTLPALAQLEDGQLAVMQRDLDAAREEVIQLIDVIELLFPRKATWLKNARKSKWPWRVIARNVLRRAGNPFHPIAVGPKCDVLYTLRHSLQLVSASKEEGERSGNSDSICVALSKGLASHDNVDIPDPVKE